MGRAQTVLPLEAAAAGAASSMLVTALLYVTLVRTKGCCPLSPQVQFF
jgi:hypothetical protein